MNSLPDEPKRVLRPGWEQGALIINMTRLKSMPSEPANARYARYLCTTNQMTDPFLICPERSRGDHLIF